LTNIYYGKLLFPYLKHYYLKSVWREFISRPARRQILKEAMTFIAQWFQPMEDISYSHIETELYNIAQRVIECLKIKWPLHPILSASHEQFSYWKCNNIDETHWNDKDAKQILDTLCEVLVELNFFTEDDSVRFVRYYFINNVSYIL